VTITPFGGEARTGHFTPDRVWVEDANDGVVEERATHGLRSPGTS